MIPTSIQTTVLSLLPFLHREYEDLREVEPREAVFIAKNVISLLVYMELGGMEEQWRKLMDDAYTVTQVVDEVGTTEYDIPFVDDDEVPGEYPADTDLE